MEEQRREQSEVDLRKGSFRPVKAGDRRRKDQEQESDEDGQ